MGEEIHLAAVGVAGDVDVDLVEDEEVEEEEEGVVVMDGAVMAVEEVLAVDPVDVDPEVEIVLGHLVSSSNKAATSLLSQLLLR